MPRAFICTLGFSESSVLAPVVRIGLGKNDRIIVLTPEGLGDGRTSNTLEKLKDMLNTISGGTIIFQRANIRVKNFVEAVRAIRKLIGSEAQKNEVYVNLSGGMRALVLETYTASLLAKTEGKNVSFTDLELEGSAGMVCLTPVMLSEKISMTRLKILAKLDEVGEAGIRELSKSVGLSAPTISRALRELSSEGLVKLSKEGRRVIAEISEQGKCFT